MGLRGYILSESRIEVVKGLDKTVLVIPDEMLNGIIFGINTSIESMLNHKDELSEIICNAHDEAEDAISSQVEINKSIDVLGGLRDLLTFNTK